MTEIYIQMYMALCLAIDIPAYVYVFAILFFDQEFQIAFLCFFFLALVGFIIFSISP